MLTVYIQLVLSDKYLTPLSILLCRSSTWPLRDKTFSCSTQLSMKFKMLINIDIAKIDGIFRFN